jgi:hypothetical protein
LKLRAALHARRRRYSADLVRPSPLIAALVMLAAALPVGCGGGSGGEDVTGVLDRAFAQSIESADVELDAQFEVDGIGGLDAPVRIEATGPYVAGDGGLPRLDIDLAVSAQGAGQTVSAGVLSTGERAFVKFGGEFYEQPAEAVQRADRELREGQGGEGTSLGDLGLEPSDWVAEGRDQGEQEVAGVQTRHVSAQLDVRALLSDLNGLAQRSQEAVGGVPPGTPSPLTEEQLDQVEEVVDDPRFDVYVGVEDDVVRRISANLQFVVPEEDREDVGGIEGGSLRFSLELADVGGDQQVEAPESARPIADLAQQLQGLGGLGALGGGGPDVPAPEGEEPAPAPGSGETPDVDALQGYADCIDQVQPDDAAAIERCAELLR